jgi:cell division protein FtsB
MREPLKRWGFRGLMAGLFLLAGYYAVFGGVYSVFDVQGMRAEREDMVDRLDSLIVLTDSLAHRADSLESDELAIERVAREQHGLIRDGEVLVRFRPVEGETAVGEDREGRKSKGSRASEGDPGT